MSARAWSCFAAVSVLWGMPYLFIKLAVDEVEPVFLAWSRVALGAAILVPIAWRSGAMRGLKTRWRALAAYAACEIAIPFPLISFGEQHVSSSLTAILIAGMPLMVAVLALRIDPSERADGRRLVGLLIGLAGVVALLGIDVAGNSKELLGAGAILVATVGYATAPLIINRGLAAADARGVIAIALVMSTVALAPAGLATAPTTMPSATAIASIVVLGVACTALALVLFVVLIADAGPSRASVITYVAPTVAVALGVTVLGEHIGAGAVAGLLAILAGSWLSTDGRVPPGLIAVATRLKRRRPSPAS
jgi:drug/metabolite transporter (DMT)-like permease